MLHRLRGENSDVILDLHSNVSNRKVEEERDNIHTHFLQNMLFMDCIGKLASIYSVCTF